LWLTPFLQEREQNSKEILLFFVFFFSDWSLNYLNKKQRKVFSINVINMFRLKIENCKPYPNKPFNKIINYYLGAKNPI